jgi:GGDEF domain-containing protein
MSYPPPTDLPSGREIVDYLHKVVDGSKPWTYIDTKIKRFEEFKANYGFIAGDQVLKFKAKLIESVIEAVGTSE